MVATLPFVFLMFLFSRKLVNFEKNEELEHIPNTLFYPMMYQVEKIHRVYGPTK